ncbi:MAG: hypothetical protein JWO80_4713 [Bryobacterales bacterium]|nr:hypothetical protein [Bryobacterales bacterium]
MKVFRFPLERVIHWRRTQVELERAATERLVQRRMELQSAMQALQSGRSAAETSIACTVFIDSRDLQTLSAYQERTRRERAALMERQGQLEREMSVQLAKTTEAQRRLKLLERLRAKRLREWTIAMEADEERFTAEAWLGRWPMLKVGDEKCTGRVAPAARMDRPVS